MKYFKGVIQEFGNIRWLSTRRTFWLTLFVVILGVAIGFALGALDNFLGGILQTITI